MVNLPLASACVALVALTAQTTYGLPTGEKGKSLFDVRSGFPASSSSRRSTDFPLARRSRHGFQGLQGDELVAWTESHRAGLRAKYASKLQHSSQSASEKTRRRAMTRRDTNSSTSLVNYENDSTFYAPVDIGTPAQSVNLVLDTGSSDMWTVQGKQNWSPSASSTFTNSTSPFHITYGSGDVSGVLAKDTVTLSGHTSSSQTFAIATSISQGLLGDEVEGIMGFGFKSLSTSQSTPFWQASGATEFGFYLAAYQQQDMQSATGYAAATSATQPGGTFTLGGTNSSLYQGDVNWSQVVDESYWLITLGGITVNDQSIDLSGTNKVAVDTGTTLIGAPSTVVEQIYSSVSGSQRLSSGYYTFPCTQAKSISATLHFGNQEYSLTYEQLIAGTVDTSGQTCLGSFFDIGSSSQDDLQYILGDAFLMNVYSIFNSPSSSSNAYVGFASLADGLGSTTVSRTVNQVVTASGALPSFGRHSTALVVFNALLAALLLSIL